MTAAKSQKIHSEKALHLMRTGSRLVELHGKSSFEWWVVPGGCVSSEIGQANKAASQDRWAKGRVVPWAWIRHGAWRALYPRLTAAALKLSNEHAAPSRKPQGKHDLHFRMQRLALSGNRQFF